MFDAAESKKMMLSGRATDRAATNWTFQAHSSRFNFARRYRSLVPLSTRARRHPARAGALTNITALVPTGFAHLKALLTD